MVSGPLAGVRILDLTHVWAGPLAVRMLADLGAEAVMVEAPYGRGPRVYPAEPIGGWMGGAPGEEPWNVNALFTKLHRNRKSLCLDLKTEAGRETFLALVAVADVVIENFSARAMPGMGLDFATLCEANPRIVYVSMPGYGAHGPYKDRVAFGPVIEPMCGFTNMLGYDANSPRNSAIALMDPFAATHAVGAVCAALRERNETDSSVRIEISLHDGGVTLCGPWLVEQQLGGEVSCHGNDHPGMAPHGVFACLGEDEWLALGCYDETQRRSLARIIGNSVSAEAIAAWCRQRRKDEAAALMQAAGVPAGPVNTTPDMLADPQAQARGFFVSYERYDVPMPGNPITMSELDSAEWRPCPRLGEDNAAVLEDWLSYDTARIESLQSRGVIADKPPG